MTLRAFKFYYAPHSNHAELDLDEYIVFSFSKQMASYLYLAAFSNDVDRLGWTGEEWERYEANGHPRELEDVLAAGKEGLGIYDLDKGWRVVSVAEMEEMAEE